MTPDTKTLAEELRILAKCVHPNDYIAQAAHRLETQQKRIAELESQLAHASNCCDALELSRANELESASDRLQELESQLDEYREDPKNL